MSRELHNKHYIELFTMEDNDIFRVIRSNQTKNESSSMDTHKKKRGCETCQETELPMTKAKHTWQKEKCTSSKSTSACLKSDRCNITFGSTDVN